ncbi:hypothetical protein [Streptomyces sp. NPDC056399]|uniref:hypothetical protein n=1 Tax=Streptomyces sp. NPDC056399 TaxID=3345807 RepID=UPI0035D86105
MNLHLLPLPARTAVATRARIAATVCRDRYAAPATMRTLHSIADLLDDTASACEDAPALFPAIMRPLAQAQKLMEAHPDARLPISIVAYITAPFAPGHDLPMPEPLLPLMDQHAAEETALLAELDRLHADTTAATEDTEKWLTAVLGVLGKWMRLSGEVDIDNRRPGNYQAVLAKHVACPKCSGHDVRFSVRTWATCACGYGDLWGQFLVCFCFAFDCPAIEAPAVTAV